jgi:hypothetical protein
VTAPVATDASEIKLVFSIPQYRSDRVFNAILTAIAPAESPARPARFDGTNRWAKGGAGGDGTARLGEAAAYQTGRRADCDVVACVSLIPAMALSPETHGKELVPDPLLAEPDGFRAPLA